MLYKTNERLIAWLASSSKKPLHLRASSMQLLSCNAKYMPVAAVVDLCFFSCLLRQNYHLFSICQGSSKQLPSCIAAEPAAVRLQDSCAQELQELAAEIQQQEAQVQEAAAKLQAEESRSSENAAEVDSCKKRLQVLSPISSIEQQLYIVRAPQLDCPCPTGQVSSCHEDQGRVKLLTWRLDLHNLKGVTRGAE